MPHDQHVQQVMMDILEVIMHVYQDRIAERTVAAESLGARSCASDLRADRGEEEGC